MKSPVKRKRTIQHLPINANSLFRKYERGDKRINIRKLNRLFDKWMKGEKVPWRSIGPTLIKKGPRPIH